MMTVHFKISVYFYLKIKQSMSGKSVKHVIKKSNPRIYFIFPLTV